MSAEQAIANLRAAETQWTQALKVHRLAPPDDGYSTRLRGFADACEQQAAAYRYAGDSGLAWEPLPPGSTRRRPAELLPDSGRRGPEELWEQLDLAFEDLDRALEGVSLHAIGRVFGELGDIAREISTAVAELDGVPVRKRRAG